MRATVMFGARDVRIQNVPDATIVSPTDAVVRVTRAAWLRCAPTSPNSCRMCFPAASSLAACSIASSVSTACLTAIVP